MTTVALAKRQIDGVRLARTIRLLSNTLEPKAAQEFLSAVSSLNSSKAMQHFLAKMSAGDDITPGDLYGLVLDTSKLEALLAQAYAKAAQRGTQAVSQALPVTLTFDATNPLAVEAMQSLSHRLAATSASASESIRLVLDQGLRKGKSVDQMVPLIRKIVGLLPQHAIAVANFDAGLEASGTPKGRRQKLVAGYAHRLLTYRATNIARTEVIHAQNLGLAHGWQAQLDAGLLKYEMTRKEWITALDERTCVICAELNGTKAKLDEPFVSSHGSFERPGAHPSCRCTMGLTFEFDEAVVKGEAEGHPFRGNQHTGGKPGFQEAVHANMVKAAVKDWTYGATLGIRRWAERLLELPHWGELADEEYEEHWATKEKSLAMLRAVRDAETVSPSLHRGCGSHKIASFKKGDEFDAALIGFSSSAATAKTFASGKDRPTVVRMAPTTALRTASFLGAGFQAEQEWITGGRFRVIDRAEEGGVVYLDVERIALFDPDLVEKLVIGRGRIKFDTEITNDLSEPMTASSRLKKGEAQGHPFRGNQHTGGIPEGWTVSDLVSSGAAGEIRMRDHRGNMVGHVNMEAKKNGNVMEIWIDLISVAPRLRGKNYADVLMDKVYATLNEWTGSKHVVVHNNLLPDGRKWLKSYLAERPHLIPLTSVRDAQEEYDGFDQPLRGIRVLKRVREDSPLRVRHQRLRKGDYTGHPFRGNQHVKVPSWGELQQMKKVQGPLGSQGGQWYQDASGTRWLAKPAKSHDHAQNEIAMGIVYRMAGALFPVTGFTQDDKGKYHILSKKAPEVHEVSISGWMSNPQLQARAARHYGIDAWLSHWDVHGLSADNTLVTKDEMPHRIESGGAGQYRAMGGVKETWKVGPWVEPKSMRESDQGRRMYGKMTNEQAARSLSRILDIDTAEIEKRWLDAGVTPENAKKWRAVLDYRKTLVPKIVTMLTGQVAKGDYDGHPFRGNQYVKVPSMSAGERKFSFRQARVLAAQRLGLDSFSMYTGLNGKWLPERRKLHRQIIKEMLAKPVPKQAKVILMGGLPGSGKSTFVNNGAGFDINDYLVIDSDAIKMMLLERGGVPSHPLLKGLKHNELVALVHEESSYLAKKVALYAQRDGTNLLWDMTMANPSQVLKRLRQVSDQWGPKYTSRSVFIDVPIEVSRERVMKRYLDGGRMVPLDVVNRAYDPVWGTSNRRAFEMTKGAVDEWELWSGETGKLIEKGSRHHAGG